MKKLVVLVLVLALLLCGAFFCWALAEDAGAAGAASPVTVDLTGLIIAVLLAAFEFLMARFAHKIIPPAKAWLEAHTTKQERGLLWNAVCELVDAAEQIIKGPALGERRMAYVQAGLRQRGLAIDTDMIEAAVKQMNDRMMLTVGNAFDVTPVQPGDVDVNDGISVDLEITHWSLDMLKSFCKLNDIPAEGCVTREDYMDAIERGATVEDEAAQAESCQGKDYCELDENGNPIPEEPQSVNE